MELERLRKEKLKLVKSNCDANRKVSDLKRQRQSLSKHLNTVKRQVEFFQNMLFTSENIDTFYYKGTIVNLIHAYTNSSDYFASKN